MASRKKGKTDTDAYMKERNYRQVVFLRQQNDREQRRLEHMLNCKHGIIDVHKWNMNQIDEERARIENEVMKLRNTTTTTWGFLPPRPGKKGDPPTPLSNPFEKSFAAEKMFKKSRSNSRNKGLSPVHSVDIMEDDELPIPVKTSYSSPGNLESIGAIDVKKSKQNIFDRLSKPKKPVETQPIPTGTQKPPIGRKKALQTSKDTVVYTYDKYIADYKSPSPELKHTSKEVLKPLKPALVNNHQPIYNPKEAVFHIIHEDNTEEMGGVLFYKPPTGRKFTNNSNKQVITKSIAYKTPSGDNVNQLNNEETKHAPKTVTYADDVIADSPDKIAFDDNKENINKTHVNPAQNDSGINREVGIQRDVGENVTDNNSKKPPLPRTLAPIKEANKEYPPVVKRERSRQFSFARSSTKASSFLSGSSNSKMTNKKKKLKIDKNLPGEEEIEKNPDGSIRTIHAMPDFNEMLKEAVNARYLRMRNPVWFEREISVSEIWKDREKPLKQRLRLK